MWRFWIDVGGTFTDTLAVSPDGKQLQSKVLSSGLTKGRIVKIGSDGALVSDSFDDADEGFWNGVTLRLVDDAGRTVSTHIVESFSCLGSNQAFVVTPSIHPDSVEVAKAIELDADVHAPVVALSLIHI